MRTNALNDVGSSKPGPGRGSVRSPIDQTDDEKLTPTFFITVGTLLILLNNLPVYGKKKN